MKGILKNRFIISAASFVLIFAALLILVIIPSFKEIRLINAQVYEERVRLEKLYTQGQLKREAQKNYNLVKEKIDAIDGIMLSEGQELEYITIVENTAEDIGLSMGLSIGENKRFPEQRFSELAFTFTLTGEWENIVKWVDKIESLPYYTNIKSSSISIHEDEGTKRTATAAIEATTYWLIPSS